MENRQSLIKSIQAYKAFDENEALYIPEFLNLLKEENCYQRSNLHGHITASVWVTNKSKDQVLLLHHKKLDKWLQPGGHADGNENLIAVAMKELEEETGLSNVSLQSHKIFDLDIHTIPERKGVPIHKHYDVRFLVVADVSEKLLQNHESTALRWFHLDKVPKEESMQRMVDKLKKLG